MKILHIIEPFASGVTTFIIHLTRELSEHDHMVLHGARTSVDRVDAVRSRFPAPVRFELWRHARREVGLNDFRAFVFLLGFLRRHRQSFDVIHLHSSKAGFLGQLACRLLGIRHIIYSPHAGAFLRKDVSEGTRRFYVHLERWSQRIGRATIVCCSKEEQRDYLKAGINALCIPNGTPITEIARSDDPSDMLVICSALLKPQKNPGLFNEIAIGLESEPRIRFIWIGDGELRGELTAPNITVTGWLESAAVVDYYAKASVYLATSAWEGMPYSVLEAMNARCVLILTDCGGHRELVEQGKNGFLFQNAKEGIAHLSWMLGHRDRWVDMGNYSRILCSRFFDSKAMAEAYNQLYGG